ncbi:MAG: hypothetical protein VKJ86_07975 [Synechococcus sp.]|nr:hypothetical protein [Synechococcus sp.]
MVGGNGGERGTVLCFLRKDLGQKCSSLLADDRGGDRLEKVFPM